MHIDADGVVKLHGKPFYGFGVNMFPPFIRNLQEPVTKVFRRDFALMEQYEIPFVRIPFSGWDCSLYRVYENDPERYFAAMDEVVTEAERHHVGIIASLMWMESAVACYVKEKRCRIGDTNSKTMAFAKRYVADVVRRYAGRRGIWGWEIGNEYNLTADLCDPTIKDFLWPDISSMPHGKIDGFDFYTSRELHTFYAEISREIRKHDSYRMISSGNGDMRSKAWQLRAASDAKNEAHLWKNGTGIDTVEQFDEMNAFFTPDPMDTVCFHLQHGTLNGNPPKYDLVLSRWGRTDVSAGEYFKEFARSAKKLHKGLFFGEFGDFMDMEQDEQLEDAFVQVMIWIREAGIQLAASWQFCYRDNWIYINDEMPNDRMKLVHMREENLKYRQEGKQDLTDAWK